MEELFCDEDGEMEWKETARFDLILFWKMGYLPPLFCFAFCTVDANSFFSTTMLIVDFNGIRTRIVMEDGKHTDHLTTTTTMAAFYCFAFFNLVLIEDSY